MKKLNAVSSLTEKEMKKISGGGNNACSNKSESQCSGSCTDSETGWSGKCFWVRHTSCQCGSGGADTPPVPSPAPTPAL